MSKKPLPVTITSNCDQIKNRCRVSTGTSCVTSLFSQQRVHSVALCARPVQEGVMTQWRKQSSNLEYTLLICMIRYVH